MVMAMVPRLGSLSELGRGERLSVVMATQQNLELDAAGHPKDPVVAFDADSCAGLPNDALKEIAGHVRGFRAITVAVGRRAPVSPLIADATDLVLATKTCGRYAIVTDDPIAELAAIQSAVEASTPAALTLAWLLRGDRGDVASALAAESAAYSTLLAGPDFVSWLRKRGPAWPRDDVGRVNVERVDDVLKVVLARPARRNAVDASMRSALFDAISIACHDPNLKVRISALGPDFSAGGDLYEFGTAPDPATAHLVRVCGSVGLLLHRIRDRVTVRVHGACIGAGIELPSFAGEVVATPETSFRLPEISMGLVPGAGGTVSIPRRIGRWRTMWMALRGIRVEAETALRWGLVDAVE
jgi:hypothetical protein